MRKDRLVGLGLICSLRRFSFHPICPISFPLSFHQRTYNQSNLQIHQPPSSQLLQPPSNRTNLLSHPLTRLPLLLTTQLAPASQHRSIQHAPRTGRTSSTRTLALYSAVCPWVESAWMVEDGDEMCLQGGEAAVGALV